VKAECRQSTLQSDDAVHVAQYSVVNADQMCVFVEGDLAVRDLA